MTSKNSQIQLDPNTAIKVIWRKQSQKKMEFAIEQLIEINTHNILSAYEKYVSNKLED